MAESSIEILVWAVLGLLFLPLVAALAGGISLFACWFGHDREGPPQ
jgi:hypothetical protein